MMMMRTKIMMMIAMKVNTMAVMEATEVVMERMSGRGGLIVNTASLAGVIMIITMTIALMMMVMTMIMSGWGGLIANTGNSYK